MAILESLRLDILWPGPASLTQKVILMAKMVLHLLDPASQNNVAQLAREHGVSRETLYQRRYTAIAVLGIACSVQRQLSCCVTKKSYPGNSLPVTGNY